MNNQELRKLLEQLHNEMDHTESVDKRGRELLLGLEADIQELLERSGSESIKPQLSTVQRLEDAIHHLEVTHPTITMALSEMLAILSNAGI